MSERKVLLDFSEILRTLHIINRYIEELRSISCNAPSYGVEKATKAQAKIRSVIDELIAAVAIYSIHNLTHQAKNMLHEITDEALHSFPNIDSFSDKKRQEGVEYGVYIMLQSYVQHQLKKEYPSIIDIDAPYQSISNAAAAIILPELGSTAIVFQDKDEACICFNHYVQQFSARLVFNAHDEAYAHQNMARSTHPSQKAG